MWFTALRSRVQSYIRRPLIKPETASKKVFKTVHLFPPKFHLNTTWILRLHSLVHQQKPGRLPECPQTWTLISNTSSSPGFVGIRLTMVPVSSSVARNVAVLPWWGRYDEWNRSSIPELLIDSCVWCQECNSAWRGGICHSHQPKLKIPQLWQMAAQQIWYYPNLIRCRIASDRIIRQQVNKIFCVRCENLFWFWFSCTLNNKCIINNPSF